MNLFLTDLKWALRSLRKSPGFACLAVIMLAVGMAVNTAVFSVYSAVALKPLPYQEPQQLLVLWETTPKGLLNSISALTFLDWKNQNKVFSQISASTTRSFNLSGTEQPEKIDGLQVSANYFDLLGVKTALGRGFSADEEHTGSEHVAIMTNRLWRERFGGNRDLINNAITLDGEKYTVVGVLPADSSFDRDTAQLFSPLVLDPAKVTRSSHFLNAMARLRPEVTLAQAQADMEIIAAGIARQSPQTNQGWGVGLVPLHKQVVSAGLQQTALVLLLAVTLVMLIACANVANLTLARATIRQRELAVRAALGATPWRLLRQLLAESLLLALISGGIAVLLAEWLISTALRLVPAGTLPAEASVTLDARVFAFMFGLSLATAFLFGYAPAWRASKADAHEALKQRTASGGAAGRSTLGKALVVTEMALALMLLTGASLLLRTLQRIQQAEVGFDPTNVVTMHVALPPTGYSSNAQVAGFYEEVLRRIGTVPGVEHAALVTDLPIVGWTYGVFFDVESKPSATKSLRPGAHVQSISADYFRTLSIPLLRGRGFTDQDTASSTPVAIINNTLAQRFFPGADPIGQRLLVDSSNTVTQIVGVVGNVRVYGVGSRAPAVNSEIYFPISQQPIPSSYIAVRTRGNQPGVANLVQRQIWSIDKNQPVTSVRTLEQVVGLSMQTQRFNAAALGWFAAIALLLAGVGIYGMISYVVSHQTREIGIRMALGGQTSDVLRMVLSNGLTLALIGIAIGLAASFATTRVMKTMLYGVQATDPISFALTPLLLLATALLACYVPARRAAKVDPMVALRYE